MRKLGDPLRHARKRATHSNRVLFRYAHLPIAWPPKIQKLGRPATTRTYRIARVVRWSIGSLHASRFIRRWRSFGLTESLRFFQEKDGWFAAGGESACGKMLRTVRGSR